MTDIRLEPEEIGATMAAVAAGQHWRPIMVLASDGTDVPAQPQTVGDRGTGYKEAWTIGAR